MVHRITSASTSTTASIEMTGWRPDAAPGLRLAAGRAHLGQSEPQRAEPRHGALPTPGTVMLEGTTLSRRARHDPAARTVRRARHRRARRRRRDAARSRPQWLRGLRAARHAGSSRPSTSTPASCAAACRSTPRTRRTITTRSALAPAGAGVQGDPQAAARTTAVARFPLRVRARPARHRRDQRRACLARMGRRRRRRRRATWIGSRRPTRRRGLNR